MTSRNKKMDVVVGLFVLFGLSSCFGPFAKDKKEAAPPPSNSESPVTIPCEKQEQGVKLTRGRGFLFGKDVQRNPDGGATIQFAYDNGGTGQLALKPEDIEEITPKRCTKPRATPEEANQKTKEC